MTEATTPPIPAIIRKEFRENITFAGVPSQETCKQLRKYGFEFDRRTGQWYRNDVQGAATDEQTVVSNLTA